MGAYFALSVAAAGWHSGALVLVNDELVQAIADSVTENDPLSVSDAVGNNSGMFSTIGHNLKFFVGLVSVGQGNEAESAASDADIIHRPAKGKKYIWANDPFPRIRLSSGEELLGEARLSEWLEPPPRWNLEYIEGSTSEMFGVRGWRRLGG